MKCIYLMPAIVEPFPYPNQCKMIAIVDLHHKYNLNVYITRNEWENQGGE